LPVIHTEGDPMRQRSRLQLPLTAARVEHEHARILQAISDVLDEIPETCDLVQLDLNRSTRGSTGRHGMSAEQVLRCLILKQMNGFTYEELSFHVSDSSCYRHFCRFDFAQSTPKKSTLQRNFKLLRAETLEVVNDLLLKSKRALKLEDGRKIRADSTVMETNIHAPANLTLIARATLA
jgi:transposase, IS5 family